MEVTATKSLPLAIAAMSVLFLLAPRVCRATAVESGNETTPSLFSAGHPENGLVADDDWQSEFMMDSQISRMLMDGSPYVTIPRPSNPKNPAVDCGRGKRYTPCVPDPNKPPKGENCDNPFKRNC